MKDDCVVHIVTQDSILYFKKYDSLIHPIHSSSISFSLVIKKQFLNLVRDRGTDAFSFGVSTIRLSAIRISIPSDFGSTAKKL